MRLSNLHAKHVGGLLLPEVDDTEFGLLPSGRHPTTLDEIEARFVTRAPYSAERARIWDGFRTWEALLREQVPTAILWINGGFVTHKQWEPPSDLDVFVLARTSEVTTEVALKLVPLLTTKDFKGNRIQPMSGLVDAHLGARGNASVITYWDGWWQRVRGSDGLVVPTLSKGYLEVKP